MDKPAKQSRKVKGNNKGIEIQGESSDEINVENQESKSNMVVNMVNITDIIDSHNMDISSSCVVLIGVEPFVLKDLTIEGIKRDIKITKDHDGNIYINKSKAEFSDLGNGIKILVMLSDENEKIKRKK